MNNREVGTKYEQAAALYLEKNGYSILETNYRCRIGEIDLIATSDEYLCFIEVKYRSSTQSGYPGEAITYHKMKKITKTAQYYMLTHQVFQDTPCRFDVVMILDHDITLIKNAFDGVN